MAVSFLLAVSCVALTIARLLPTLRASSSEPTGNASLAVLMLTSSDPGYFSQPLITSGWAENLLGIASENGSYQLQMLSLDTQCIEESALNGFLGHLLPDANDGWSSGEESAVLVAILGGGCVTDSETIADTVSRWKIPLISYSPFLYSPPPPSLPGDGVYHFRMYPSLGGVVTALVATMLEYGWTQMSIISEFNYPFLQMEQDIIVAMTAAEITVLRPAHVQREDDPADVPYLFAKYARVIFLNTYEDKAAEILCLAYQEGQYYPDYVWLLYGWYSDNWWTRTSATTCNSAQLLVALERAIILQSYPLSRHLADDSTGIFSYSYFAPLVDDSIQLLNQALNDTVSCLCGEASDSHVSGMLDGSCDRGASFGDLLSASMLGASFEGKSGRVEFDENGERVCSQVELFQFRNGSDGNHFANVFLVTAGLQYEANENNETVWPGGIPQDGSPVNVTTANSLLVVGTIYTFSFAGIIFTFVCLGFNIVFRNRKIVKLTSPNLNYFIIAGGLSLYVGCLVQVVPSTSLLVWDYVCQTLAPTLCIGYSLCFGTILAKMWRIYYIFHNPTPKKKEIKDWHLAVVVSVILAINLVLISFGFIIPACRPSSYLASDVVNPPAENEKGIVENYYLINCFSRPSFFWQLSLYLYLALLQTAALVLAFKTRKVKIKVLNDSREISATIYVTSVIDVELLVVSFLLLDYSNIQDILFVGGVFIATTSIIGLVFIPKMVALYRDPQGKRIFGNVVVHSSVTTEKVSLQAERARVLALEKEVQSLQTQLKQQQVSDKGEDEKWTSNL